MVEFLTVVAVIAVFCAIAIPSVIAISNSLANRRANDYAKSIYLAAQAQLATLKAEQPTRLEELNGTETVPSAGNAGLGDNWNENLHYAVTGRDQTFLDELLLPSGSIDATIRDKKILIEYNAATEEIYSVFFLDEPASGGGLNYDSIMRDPAERKAIHLGYYQANSNSNVLPSKTYSENLSDTEVLSYDNNYGAHGDGVLTVRVPIPDDYPTADQRSFAENLNIELTIEGQQPGETPMTIDLTSNSTKMRQVDSGFYLEGGQKVASFSYVLDSVYNPDFSFHSLVGGRFADGENVSLTVHIEDESEITTFDGLPNSLSSVNPLYASLSGSTLEVENARNLQNLNKYDKGRLGNVQTIALSDSFDWYGDRLFTPLRENVCGFKTFDGAGNRISGLKIDDSKFSGDAVGLFTALNTGNKVTNLTLNDLLIKLSSSTGKSVGAIAGTAADATISNCSVSGKITGSGASSYVGGAVGKEQGAGHYQNVSADVTLSGWGGTSGDPTPGDPSGLGVNVGKFIGYVDSGRFENCSATGSADQSYQFLGKIAYNISELAGAYFSSLESSEKSFSSESEDGTFANLSAYAKSKGMTMKSEKCEYAATLTNCRFKSADAMFSQLISREYLYLGKEGDGTFSVENCGAKIVTNLTKSNLSSDRDKTRYIIYDVTNDAILLIPDIDGKKTSTYPSPVIGSDGLLISKENSASCTKGNYGWGFNDFKMDKNMLYFAYSGGYGIRFAKGYFYDVSGGSMDIYQYGNGEFTFLDTYDSTYYLKFDPETRVYNVTKASSKSTPPADAPHFVLVQYNVKDLASTSSVESGGVTLKITHNPDGFLLDLQESDSSYLCTSEAYKSEG